MYYIVYFFFYLISLLPLRILYVLSDAIYLLMYYVVGYRKKVVMGNLDIVFPGKSREEKVRIAKKFYQNFIDSFIETIKLLSAPDSFFEKRFTGNWELINQYYDQGRPVQLHLGHTFNWEWGNVVIPKKIRHQFLGVYMPLHDKTFNKLFMKMRSRTGAILISALNMTREFLPYRKTLFCLGLVADQSPGSWMHHAKWFRFFNKIAPFTVGPAKSAIANNAVVIFACIHRPKRGQYEVAFTLAEENPKGITEIALTKKFIDYLENTIAHDPDMWLWTHKRWKREWKEEYGIEG